MTTKRQRKGGENPRSYPSITSYFSGSRQTLTSSPSSSRRSKRSRGGEKDREEEGDDQKKMCGICLMHEGRGVRGQIDCCDHYYCFVCIMEWAKKESLCPMCKQRFRSVRRPPKDGVFARERIIHVPIRDQVHHPLQNVTSAHSNPHAHACCSECQSSEDEHHLLCCALCKSASHTYCVGLGVSTVPQSDWYCHDCTISRNECAENEVSSSMEASNTRLSSPMFHGKKMMGERSKKDAATSSPPVVPTSSKSRRGQGFVSSISPSTSTTIDQLIDRYEMRAREASPFVGSDAEAHISDAHSSEEGTEVEMEAQGDQVREGGQAGEDVAGTSSASSRRGKGSCKGKSLAPKPGTFWHVRYNSKGKPIGEEGRKLHRKVGNLARDPRYCPLVRQWKDVPAQGLEDLWDEILHDYDFGGHPGMKEHVFSVAHDRWKDWKNYLKKEIWEQCMGDEDKLKERLDGRVLEEQWKKMVDYWESPEGKAAAERASRNRAKKVMKHHSGTVTFAQVGADMVTDGVEPEDLDVFIKAYTPKDPTKDPETTALLQRIEVARQTTASSGNSTMEPILTQVIGEGKGKYVRGLGKHHKRKDVATSSGQYSTHAMANLVQRNEVLEKQVADQHIEMNQMKELLQSLCAFVHMPSQPSSTPEERRTTVDEEQHGSRPGSSSHK